VVVTWISIIVGWVAIRCTVHFDGQICVFLESDVTKMLGLPCDFKIILPV